jgi:hypothetical protein
MKASDLTVYGSFHASGHTEIPARIKSAERKTSAVTAGVAHLQMFRIQLFHLLFSEHQLIMNENMHSLVNHDVMNHLVSPLERVRLDDT